MTTEPPSDGDPQPDGVNPAGRSAGLGRSTALMAAGTATSRVLGVVRAAVLVAAIGQNSTPANAFATANVLPTTLYMLIAGGVLNAVLVPQVVRAYRSPNGQDFVDRLLTVAAALLLGITVALTLAAPLIARLATGGRDAEYTALVTLFALWCLPQIFFYGAYTLLGQVLNARGSFGPYMWAPVVNNVVSTLGMVVFIIVFGAFTADGPSADVDWWDGGRIALLGGTATLGIALQAAVLVIPLRRSGFRYRPRRDWRGTGLGSAGRVAGWTFAALAAGAVGTFTVMNIANAAAQESSGATDVAGYAAYGNAFAIFMLPHSLVTVSLLTAMFTRLSRHAAADDTRSVRADFSYGLRALGVFTVFATAVLCVLALPLVRIVLPTTRPSEAASLVPIIVALALGLVTLGAWSLSQRVFYAYEDARGLFWIQVAMAGVVVGGTLLGYLVLPVRWWVAGAGASIAASYLLGAIWGGLKVRSRLGGSPHRVLQVHVRAAVAAAVAAGVGWAVLRAFGDLSGAGFGRAVLVSVVVGTLMLAIYLGLLRLMGVDEVHDLVEPLRARLGRSMSRRGSAGVRRMDHGAGESAELGGDLLDGVVIGRGTLLAGRYRLQEPQAGDLPGVEGWSATDQILDRPVRALVLRSGRVRPAQDAARRAALVNDPRLLRVLDVGDHEGLPYVVTEPLVGRTLAELTARGPLPADQARAIIGEAAVALEVARRRGVHHLALRPTAVRVKPDGGVVVSGLALDGELAGHGLGDARSTTRADTVGLVSLLYLTLTGRWPAPSGADPGAATLAPVVAGAPVAPAELSPAVPNDLDTLCAVTLGPHDDGPHSPAELVRELEPWGPVAAPEIFGALDAAAAWGSPATSAAATAAVGGTSAPVAESAAPRETADVRDDDLPGEHQAGNDSAGSTPDAPPPTEALDPRTVQRQSVRGTFDGATVPARPGTPPPAIPPAYRREDPRTVGAAGAGRTGQVSAPVPPPRSVSTAALPSVIPPPAAGGSTSGGPTGASAGAGAGGSVGTAAGRAPLTSGSPGAAPVHRPVADRRPPVGGAGSRTSTTEHESFDSLIGRSTDVLTRRRFDPTPFILLLVLAGVVIGVMMAWNALQKPTPPIGGPGGFDIVGEGPAAEPGTEGTDDTEGTEGTEDTEGSEGSGDEGAAEPPPPPAPPQIASAQMIDPPPGGDNNEHPEAVDRAIDGDPTTFWFTRTYVSPTYGMKPGVGYAVTLTAPATVSTVTLNVNGTGGMVEVRATDPATPTEGEVLASGPLGPETVLTLSAPTETQHIVLWFTALPQTADGSNRVELTEIRVA